MARGQERLFELRRDWRPVVEPIEGVNTKTKRIARQMHGRAGFALLRHRILLGQQTP